MCVCVCVCVCTSCVKPDPVFRTFGDWVSYKIKMKEQRPFASG